MKLKLDRQDLQLLINILQVVESFEFSNEFESQVCRSVSLAILQKLVKKLADMKPKNSISLEPIQIVVLRRVLPVIHTQDQYAHNFINDLILKIDPICLSI